MRRLCQSLLVKTEKFKAEKMWENSGGEFLRNHCFISSTRQRPVLMKLRWMRDRKPQGSLAKLPPGMTMRAPVSLAERCHFKKKQKKKIGSYYSGAAETHSFRARKIVILLQLPLKSTDIPNYMHFYCMRHGHNVYTHLRS